MSSIDQKKLLLRVASEFMNREIGAEIFRTYLMNNASSAPVVAGGITNMSEAELTEVARELIKQLDK